MKPRIYYANGWWHVKGSFCKEIYTIWNKACDFANMLNCKLYAERFTVNGRIEINKNET